MATTRLRRTAALLASAALLATLTVATFAAPASAAAVKVDVCHSEGNGDFHLIEVAEQAYPKHVEHGDASPGDPVPGQSQYIFGADCASEAAILGCFAGIDIRRDDAKYIGPADTLDNATWHSSHDGSCTGPVTQVRTLVTASSAANASATCAALGRNYAIATMDTWWQGTPADLWLCD